MRTRISRRMRARIAKMTKMKTRVARMARARE